MRFVATAFLVLCSVMAARTQTSAPPLHILQPPDSAPTNALAWDAVIKQCAVGTNVASVAFTFWVTNVAPTNILILSTSTSCGCTVAKLPSQPWVLEPGDHGPIRVTLDLHGRYGAVLKGINVQTSVGVKALVVRALVPIPPSRMRSNAVSGADLSRMKDRAHNLQIALADRQAVFKGDCARCHSLPARGKTGAALYAAACGICHEAKLRATMVPDLRQPREPRSPQFWKKIIAHGGLGSLMPAFAVTEGGPLTGSQIDSLVQYLQTTYPTNASVSVSSSALPSPTGH